MPARKRAPKRHVVSPKISAVIMIEPTGDRFGPWLVDPRDLGLGFGVTYRTRDRDEARQKARELIAAAKKEGKTAVAKFADAPPHDPTWGASSAGDL